MRVTSITHFVRLCAEEPFRIFFPIGTVCGAIGVLLWPLFFGGAIATYPATMHARLMIEGMLSCFIFGFLGTAGPRVRAVPHFEGGEVATLLALIIAAALGHLLSTHALGDTLFLLALGWFASALARRFLRREDSPPPNFALVGLGLLNGLVGAAIIVFCEWTASAPTLYRLGSSLLNVAFVLFPVLGVAPFFMRRLLEMPADENGTSIARQFALAVLVGVTIELTFVLELFSANPLHGWLRCGAALVYLAMTLPLRGKSKLVTALRMSLATLPAGLALVALLPAYRISALHVLFIGSFSIAVFAVATRVVLGHSGNLDIVQRRRWLFAAALILLILTMIARFVADFVASRNEHLVSAAFTCCSALRSGPRLCCRRSRRSTKSERSMARRGGAPGLSHGAT